MKVEYHGAFYLPTGYGSAARGHAKALEAAGATVLARHCQDYSNLQHEWVYDEKIEEMLKRDGRGDVAIVHTTPNHGAWVNRGVPTTGYSVWETTQLPDGWADKINQMPFIITASEFSKEMIVNSGVKIPVYVCGHPIDLEIFNPEVEPVKISSTPDFIFLAMAQWMPRKGLEDLISAFYSEFTNGEQVVLALISYRWGHNPSEKAALDTEIRNIRDGLNIPNTPKVWFLGNKFSDNMLPALYRVAHCFVNPTRGEAFSLPTAEAAACGLPCLVTGWSSMKEFLGDDGYYIDYRLESARGCKGWETYNAKQLWAVVDFMDLRGKLRYIFDHRDEAKERGVKLAQKMKDIVSYKIVGQQMIEILQQGFNAKPKYQVVGKDDILKVGAFV